MSLISKLLERERADQPIRVGIIGAGKFATMFLAQVPRTPGLHIVGIADLLPSNAKSNLERVGWNSEQSAASSLDDAMKHRTTHITDNWEKLVSFDAIDVIVECTGNPVVAVEHCLASFDAGKHVVNVTVEADAFCGPLLARRADSAGVVYSLAFGDQPALICDLVDWARGCGFPVVAAGRGHKWLPHFSESTPETVWDNWGLTAEEANVGGLNPKMFNSFLDGSKPAIECTAVANACNLDAPENGLAYTPASIDEMPTVLRPRAQGGLLEKNGVVEVISSLREDGTPIPYEIRNGVWVCIEGESDYIQRCFKEYGVHTDPSGRYSVIYRRWHLIGLEVGISVASVALRGEATGVAHCFNADVAATAKRDLQIGDTLDGEGGYTVFGTLQPARKSVQNGFLPLGLASNLAVIRPIQKGECVRWVDVKLDETIPAYQFRREMEAAFN